MEMQENSVKFLLLTSKDPWLPPTGGTSAFARQILHVFKDEIAIASPSSQESPKGKWLLRDYEDVKIRFFSLGQVDSKKGLLPSRIKYAIRVLFNNKNLKSLNVNSIFIDSPETVLALTGKWENVCYMFHGLNNPISHGRFKTLQPLGRMFEKWFFSRLERLKPTCLLAAADERSIQEFYHRTKWSYEIKIRSFPTRVDNNIFKPAIDVQRLKEKLNIKADIVFTTTGRLAKVKGWEFLLDVFSEYNKINNKSLLIFVGDGEDRNKIQNKIKHYNLEQNVLITGFVDSQTVADYINVADLCLVGSFREGWSVAMCEILACGKGMVSTNVSGANQMIIDGKNGYVIEDRNVLKYVELIKSAILLKEREEISYELSKKFLLGTLRSDVLDCFL